MITIADGRMIFMSPDDNTLNSYLSYIQAQQKRIYIADYSFNLMPLVDLLIAKKNEGVDVRLVLDKSQSAGVTEKPEVAKLLLSGFPLAIGTSSKHKIMHMKFTVGDNSCQYGSWNYTTAASDEDNFFLIDPTPVVSQWFLQVWQEMFDWIKLHEVKQ